MPDKDHCNFRPNYHEVHRITDSAFQTSNHYSYALKYCNKVRCPKYFCLPFCALHTLLWFAQYCINITAQYLYIPVVLHQLGSSTLHHVFTLVSLKHYKFSSLSVYKHKINVMHKSYLYLSYKPLKFALLFWKHRIVIVQWSYTIMAMGFIISTASIQPPFKLISS